MKRIIAGSREGVTYEDVEKAIVRAFAAWGRQRVKLTLCGMARGADLLGKRWSEENGIRSIPYDPEWGNLEAPGAIIRTRPDGSKYNLNAGFARNQDMVNDATHAIFVRRKGKSSGTDDCIRRAKAKGIPIYIHSV
jgi:hypothetical protein